MLLLVSLFPVSYTHLELAAPVSHIWYFKGTPSRIGQVLDISPKRLEEVLYFTKYIVVDPGDTVLTKKQILTEKEYADMRERYEDDFRAEMGAEAIKELLCEIDLDKLSEELKKELEDTQQGQKRVKLLKRLDVVEAFRLSGNRPEWMILCLLYTSTFEYVAEDGSLDDGFTTKDIDEDSEFYAYA